MSTERSPAERDRRRRLLILGVLWVFICVVLIVCRSVLLPFASAALIAYLVAPLVDRISRVRIGPRTVPRWVAILVIYALFFLLVYLAIIALVPQLYRELARISRDAVDYANSLTPDRIREVAQQLERWLLNRGVPVELSARALEGADAQPAAWSLTFDLEQMLRGAAEKSQALIRENFADIFTFSRRVVTWMLAFVFMLFFVLMLAAYMSIDGKALRAYAGTLVPSEYAADIKTLVGRIDRSLSGVVRGQVTICMVNGVLTFIGLLLFGVKFAFLLATVATLLSLIPIFGSIISSVPIVAIGMSQSWKTGLAALAWIVGIHALEAYFLNPKIMGSAARIHPLVVAFALIAGERMFGLVGALFAVPVAAVAVGCFDFARLKAQPKPEISTDIA